MQKYSLKVGTFSSHFPAAEKEGSRNVLAKFITMIDSHNKSNRAGDKFWNITQDDPRRTDDNHRRAG